MGSKVFEVPVVGSVLVCKNSRSKSISIKISPNSIPKVVIPHWLSYQVAINFVIEKQQWIAEKLISVNEKVANKAVYTSEKGFYCPHFCLNISYYEKTKPSISRNGQSFTLHFPKTMDLLAVSGQKMVSMAIEGLLKVHAKKYLPARTLLLAQKHGFTINKVFVKNLKSKWGSCSMQKNINLNIHLLRMPEYLSDFIILHELCHTVHMNHGEAFHALLNSLCGDEKKLNRELKQFRLG